MRFSPRLQRVEDGSPPANGRVLTWLDGRWQSATAPGGPGGGPHATSHQNNGSDEISVAGLSGTLADPQTPAAHSHSPSEVTGTAVVTSDSRLSDARTPTTHAHAPSDITGTAVVTADARLSDARTPLTHSHAQSDVTDLATALAGKSDTGHTHSTYQATSEKAQANGYASLGTDGKVPAAQLPASSGGGFALTAVEISLGSVARRSGRFTIAGSGMTPAAPVLCIQLVGPYTGKGTRSDEAEMDSVTVAARVLDANTIEGYWRASGRVRGNVRFGYAVGG